MLANFKEYFIGGIWSETYEQLSEGGPKCFNQLPTEFRFGLGAFSAITTIIYMYLIWPTIKNSKELDLTRTQNLNPNILEKITGYLGFFTYFASWYFKLKTGRGVFMNNPCHWCVLFQSYLMVTQQTQVGGVIFIAIMRWAFCPWFAMFFPHLTGLDLPWELQTFFLQHYLAAYIGPALLIFSGRYGVFYEGAFSFFQHQLFGFGTHILYMKLINIPLSHFTWANINFMLCHSEADISYRFVGKYYIYFGDWYLNSASFLIMLLVYFQAKVLQLTIKKPYLFIQGMLTKEQKD